MKSTPSVLRIATRGSALALAQANLVLALCRREFPELQFELKIIKTTGDKLQTASMSGVGVELPKGLFTKEIEEALLGNEADFAVHSLKDLPTELPEGLVLGAVTKRADARDVLIYRDEPSVKGKIIADWSPGQPREWRGFRKGLRLAKMPAGSVIGTSSTRREAQARTVNAGLRFAAIRGNVGTRLRKLAEDPGLDALILAAAGLERLSWAIFPDGHLRGEGVPEGLIAVKIEPDEIVPCVGQGAIGIERRVEDEQARKVCQKLNHFGTFQSVTAERAFLRAMGGGCQSPVGGYARVIGHQIHLTAVSVTGEVSTKASGHTLTDEADRLGKQVAAELLGANTAPAGAAQTGAQ